MNDLIPVGDVERMAMAVAKSGLFGLKSTDQAMALMLIAQAEGRHPAIAARDYHVIQGRPALKADAMLARFQEAGGRVEWHSYTNDKVEASFSHPSGGSLRMGWSMADAKAAGLTGKDVWRQYPRAMLRARLISEAVRTIYPAVLCGFYSTEEIGDFDARPPAEIRMGAAVVVVPDASAARVVEPAPAPAIPVADDPAVMSLADVRRAARDAVARVGRPAVMDTLSALGWERSEEIPEGDRPAVIAALEAL